MLGLTGDDKRAARWQRLLPPAAQPPLGTQPPPGTGLWAAGRLADAALFGFAATLGGLVNCSWSVIELREAHWRLMEYNVVALQEAIPEPVTGDDQQD